MWLLPQPLCGGENANHNKPFEASENLCEEKAYYESS